MCVPGRFAQLVLEATLFPASLIFPPPRAREERPWYTLVTCLPDQKLFYQGSHVSYSFVALCFVHMKARLARDKFNSAMFFSSLHFAIVNSNYWNINLKPKQVKCLEAIYLGRDTIGVLPMGYGKSIIFHLLPGLFFDKINSKSAQSASSSSSINPVVVVVSPLNSLISDQIRRSTEGQVKATILNVRQSKDGEDDLELDSSEANLSLLKEAKFNLVFTHPEAALSCQRGIELFQSAPYQRSVQALVVDEAHCILEW